MAFAIYVKTESSDTYVFALDGEPDQDTIMNYLYDNLSGELQYVSSWDYDSTYEIDFKFNLDGFKFEEDDY